MKERKLRVLVIDDDEYSRDALTHLLAAEGYEAQAASDGQSGYASAREVRPDIIVLDLSLPDLDGREIIRLMRRDQALRDIPILVITGRSSDEAQSALDLGANAYLIKPVEFDDLLQTIPHLKAGP